MASRAAGFLSRAFGMLLRPDATWGRIAEAPSDPGALMRRYVAPLAAIPVVCGAAGAMVFGFNIANVGVRMSLLGLLLGAVAGYLLTLLAVWALATFIDLTAPAFGGQRGRTEAMNLVAYGGTASWLGGAAEAYPSLGIPVGILAGLYSLYAIYLGLPKLMRIPDDRRLTAFAAVLVAILLLAVLRGAATGWAAEIGGPLSASYAPR